MKGGGGKRGKLEKDVLEKGTRVRERGEGKKGKG